MVTVWNGASRTHLLSNNSRSKSFVFPAGLGPMGKTRVTTKSDQKKKIMIIFPFWISEYYFVWSDVISSALPRNYVQEETFRTWIKEKKERIGNKVK